MYTHIYALSVRSIRTEISAQFLQPIYFHRVIVHKQMVAKFSAGIEHMN